MEAVDVDIRTIDDYINIFSGDVKERLQTLRTTIKEVAPEAQEAIKYRMPTFVYYGNLVSFAAFKDHIGLYPSTSNIDTSIHDIDLYRTGKGTLNFPLNQPLPLALVREVVAVRMKENREKEEAKTAKKKAKSAK